MAQPSGALLIYNPVRPNDLDDNYPSAFAIDVKGGHHMYATIDERDAIKEGRREWGMLCTVFNNTADPTKNGTYQLVYNASDDNIMNPLNWRVFSGSPQSSGFVTEWVSSVSSIIDTPPGSTPSNGERFLISIPSYAAFNTQSNKIAQWDEGAQAGAGDWIYITPTNGTTLRVDNINNVLYKFVGTWSEVGDLGGWKKEYITQVRFIEPSSVDGVTYTYSTVNDMVPVDTYSNSVYFANFGYTSAADPVLEIDGLGSYNLKKLYAGSLINLTSSDLIPGIQYQLTWNTDHFMVHSLGGGGTLSLTIGPAEDGTYSDGLFTDFNPSTPIGVPIDRFNEILLALVPPPAPDLSSWSLGGPSFVSGRLSFDSSISGFSAAPGFVRGDLFNVSGYRKGINSGYLQPNTSDLYYKDITGILNSNVGAGPGNPTPAYATYSFGNGITGSLVLKFNSTTVSTVDLSSTYSAFDTTKVGLVSGLTSGMVISAATASKFPSGVPFEFFWNRTGSYLIKKDSGLIRNGYNYLELSHILPTQTLTLASYSWVTDFSTFSSVFSGENINTINVNTSNGVKTLSGVKFYNLVSLNYQSTYTNHVRNTYNPDADALSAFTVPVATTGTSNPVTNTQTTTTATIMIPSPGTETIPTPGNPLSQYINKNWSFNLASNVRRLNESITFKTSVKRTVQGTDTSSGLQIPGWFIDNYNGVTPTDLEETFETESYRKPNGNTKYAAIFNDSATVVGYNYNSTKSLLLDSGYQNALQVCNGLLIYPKYNFATASDVSKNPNFGSASTNYSLCSAQTVNGFGTTDATTSLNRTYTRLFRGSSITNFNKIKFTISSSNTTFVNSNVALTGNNCWIEMKLPHDTTRPIPSNLPPLINGAVTGWLDLTKKAVNGNWNDGDGVYVGTPTSNYIEADLGTGKSIYYSGGYILVRITASPNWSGYIDNIKLEPF